MTLVVTAKGGGAGRLFGSVTNQEIADALKAKTGIALDKRKIVINDTINRIWYGDNFHIVFIGKTFWKITC